MDFIEYVAALHLVLRGKLEDKLRWSFKVFDSDDNGYLDRNELKKIVKVLSQSFHFLTAGSRLTVYTQYQTPLNDKHNIVSLKFLLNMSSR